MNTHLPLNINLKNIIGSYTGLTKDEIKDNKDEILRQFTDIRRDIKTLKHQRTTNLKKKLFIKTYHFENYKNSPYIAQKYPFANDEIKLIGNWQEGFDNMFFPNIDVSPRTIHKIIKHANKIYDKETKEYFCYYYIRSLPLGEAKTNLLWLQNQYNKYEQNYGGENDYGLLDKYGLGWSKIAVDLKRITFPRDLWE